MNKDNRKIIILLAIVIVFSIGVAIYNNTGLAYLVLGIIGVPLPLALIKFIVDNYPNAVMVFDKRKDLFWKYFWRGEIRPNEVDNKSDLEHFIPLSDIHAVQLIQCDGGDSADYYQLNLVLVTSERISIKLYSTSIEAQKEAKSLASFLGVPLWDAIGHKRMGIMDILRLLN